MKRSEVKVFLCLLFEHQLQPEAWMRFRLLRWIHRAVDPLAGWETYRSP